MNQKLQIKLKKLIPYVGESVIGFPLWEEGDYQTISFSFWQLGDLTERISKFEKRLEGTGYNIYEDDGTITLIPIIDDNYKYINPDWSIEEMADLAFEFINDK